MSVEENLRVTNEVIDAFNSKDADRLMRHVVESVIVRFPGEPEPLKGRAAWRARFENFATAFPDRRNEIVRAFGQGDWVCVELIGTGTHTGPLKGPGGETIPATGKRVRFPQCAVFGFEGGKITEFDNYFDRAGFMAQLGLAPK